LHQLRVNSEVPVRAQLKTAIISGVNGQDGSYLAEFLDQKNYKIHGLIRPDATESTITSNGWCKSLSNIQFHSVDLSSLDSIDQLVRIVKPTEVYHLATRNEVELSARQYAETRKVDLDSTFYFLESISNHCPKARLFHASSSNIFGCAMLSPQNEQTSYCPESIYAVLKMTSMYAVKLYRTKKSVFACSGILFNHESPRRPPSFLPRKITSTAARIKLGFETELVLGDLESVRDWGFAGDFVEAMWLMLQADEPLDYVIGTGELHSVREILDICFDHLKLDWKQYVRVDPSLFRPKAQFPIVADISKIQATLGWAPKTSFVSLIKMMTEADVHLLKY
jgi:GDPmannose 4,6-dehydratase